MSHFLRKENNDMKLIQNQIDHGCKIENEASIKASHKDVHNSIKLITCRSLFKSMFHAFPFDLWCVCCFQYILEVAVIVLRYDITKVHLVHSDENGQGDIATNDILDSDLTEQYQNIG